MKKSVYLIGLLLAIFFGCKSDFDETIDTPAENGVVNDSIRKIPVSNLPNGVKEAFEQVFISEKMSAKPEETNKQLPNFNFLENEVVVISKKGGITNYSVRVKQGEQITTFLKNNTISSLTSKPKEDCNSTGAGGNQASNHIEMISINVTDNGRKGDPTFVTHTNHGDFIESNFTNLNNGNHFNTWTPNPGSVGGFSGHSGDGGTLNGYNGYRSSGGFLRDSWGKIVSLKDQIHRYIRNIICGCFNNRPGDSTSLYVNMDNNPENCRCYNGNYELNHDFSTLLPEAFFTLPKNHFKNKDCECLYEQQTKNIPDDVRFFEKIIYLECSCQKNEVGGVALFLELSPAEKAFLAQNLSFNAEICAFSNKDKTQAAKDFANEAVKAKMQGGEVDFPNRIIYNFKDKDCQMQIIKDALKVSSPLTKLINDTFNSSGKVNLVIVIDHIERGIAAVSPRFEIKDNKAYIKMILDSNFSESATDLALATTFIHESIHAYMCSLYIRGKLAVTNPSYKKLQEMLIIFYEEKEKRKNKSFVRQLDEEHHNVMKDFMNDIGETIYQYAKSKNINVEKQYCDDLAWGSMRGYKILKEIISDRKDRDRMVKSFENEEYNTNNAKGTPCN